jgi:hypothetical protein
MEAILMNNTTVRSESSSLTPLSTTAGQFLIAQYGSLRDEILKRTGIQHQLVSWALIATGTFIGFASTTATLTYPILAMFLAVAWIHSDIRIMQIGVFIEETIEERVLGKDAGTLGWEHYFSPAHDNLPELKRLAHLVSRGVFCGTQVLAVLATLLEIDFPLKMNGDIALLIIDALVIMFTFYLVRPRKLENVTWSID